MAVRHGLPRRLLLAGLLALTAARASAQPAEPTYPTCTPRATSDPARLNVDGAAADFGVLPPCEATLSFYIARNTRLRGLEGSVRTFAPDGSPRGAVDLEIGLSGPEGGLFKAREILPPDPDHGCRALDVELRIAACRGPDGDAIACPAVRLLSAGSLGSLRVRGDDLRVCVD